jgi:hypothetical protein
MTRGDEPHVELTTGGLFLMSLTFGIKLGSNGLKCP